MAKKTRAVIVTEYVCVRIFVFLCAFLPWTAARFAGRLLGRACRRVFSSRTKILKDNFQNAFPQKTPAEVNRLSVLVWENIGMTLMEFLKMPYLNPGNIGRFVRFEGAENIKRAAAKNKGIIFFTGHFFNWEIANIVFAFAGYEVAIIAKPFDNPLISALVTKIRQHAGGRIIFHRQAIKEGLKHLKNNKCLGVLIDQHYGGSDIEVNFFGRMAKTSPIIAAFTGRTGSPVIPIRCIRDSRGLVVQAMPEVELPVQGDARRFNIECTGMLTSIIEGWIREFPEGWFWVHRRWR